MSKPSGIVDEIVGTLQREGGELTVPDITGNTMIPSQVVESVVRDLEQEGTLSVREVPGSGLRVIKLTKEKGIFASLASLLKKPLSSS